jgi:hypothetical protein
VVLVFGPSEQSQPDPGEKQEFWTDANGRQMVRRVQDTRFSYDLGEGATNQPISSNYYPITSGTFQPFKVPSFYSTFSFDDVSTFST